jgi:hypothetical protein
VLNRETSARAFANAASLGPQAPASLGTAGPDVAGLAGGVEPPGAVVTGDSVEGPLVVEGAVGRRVAPAVLPAHAASMRPTVTATAARTPRTPRR